MGFFVTVVLHDTFLIRHKYHMRIHEITTIKPIQPLTPAKARINALKQTKDRAADALKAERTRQKQAKAVAGVQNAQKTLAKVRIN